MNRIRRLRLPVVALLVALVLAIGCSPRQKYTDPYQAESIERPARAIDEEDSAADKAGKVLVVVIGVGIAIGLIVGGVLATLYATDQI